MRQQARMVLILVALATVALLPSIVQSAVTVTGDTATGTTIQIGNASFGTYRVDAGSVVSTNQVTIGNQTSAVGAATVTGSGSQLLATGNVDVGVSGVGRLDILSGGVVSTSFSQFRIGVNNSSQGTVVVDGSGSLLQIGSSLIFGSSTSTGVYGSSLLQISNGAIVNVPSNTTTIQSQGHMALQDGVFRTNQLTNNGLISGGGEVMILSTNSIASNNRIEAGTGQLLRFTGPAGILQNAGIISADGGEIQFTRYVTNSYGIGPGEISLRNGVIRTNLAGGSSTGLTNNAVLAATGGENDFYGRIDNGTNGRIDVTNHSVLIFHDTVSASAGTITVFPGSSAVFLDDLTVSSGAVLQANLAGTSQNSGFGQIEVAGTAQLAGAVGATLETGYTPHVGDTFPLLAAGAISGSLALGAMPALPSGLKWDLDVVANRVLLSVVPGLAGDYNGNGQVDSADYLLWRRSVDQGGTDLAADGDSNGKVDAGDLNFWRSHFGNTSGSGASAAVAVPEPASAMVLFTALALVLSRGSKLR